MPSFDVPCCSVCYEHLSSELCALARCGHVYHREWQWRAKTEKRPRGCPLCRCHIPKDGVVNLKFECGERRALSQGQEENASNTQETWVSEAALEELEDLKHRLVQAATDNLDLQEKCADGEQKNASLQESLLRVQHDKDVLDDENKDLKLEVAANRASIAKLNDKLAKQSASIHKLEHINHYLSAEGHGVDSFNTYLKKLAPDEAFTLLTNRVAELDAFNKNMTDLKDMWKRKSEKLSRDYMALQREYTALQTLYAESTHNLRLAPLEEAAPAVKRDRDAAEDCEKDAEDDGEMPRKLPRAINFGSVEGDDGAAKRRASPPGVCPPSFGQSASSGTSKSSKTKTQKISRFFKLQ